MGLGRFFFYSRMPFLTPTLLIFLHLGPARIIGWLAYPLDGVWLFRSYTISAVCQFGCVGRNDQGPSLVGVRKNRESEWELPKRNGLVVKCNDICGNITSWLV